MSFLCVNIVSCLLRPKNNWKWNVFKSGFKYIIYYIYKLLLLLLLPSPLFFIWHPCPLQEDHSWLDKVYMDCKGENMCYDLIFQGFYYFFSLSVGSEMVEAQCQRFEVRSSDGERVLFSADEEEISIGTDKLRVTGRTCANTYSSI